MQPSDSDPLLESDAFKMFCFKVLPCAKRFVHDWSGCPFAHHTEKARRRCPRTYEYAAVACPDQKQGAGCPRGERCGFAHNVFEQWLHPDRYRTQMCNSGGACNRKSCFFAHSPEQLRYPMVPTIKPLPDQLQAQAWALSTSMCPTPGPSARGADGGVSVVSEDCLTISPSSSPPVSSLNLTLEGQDWSDSSGSSLSAPVGIVNRTGSGHYAPAGMVVGPESGKPAYVITLAQLQQEAGPGSALEAALAKEQQQQQLMAMQRQRQQQHEQLVAMQQQQQQRHNHQQSLMEATEAQLRGFGLSSPASMNQAGLMQLPFPGKASPGAVLSAGILPHAKSAGRTPSCSPPASAQLDQLTQALAQLRVVHEQADAVHAARGTSAPPAMYLQSASPRAVQRALAELQLQQQQLGAMGQQQQSHAAMLALAASRGLGPHSPPGLTTVAGPHPGMYGGHGSLDQWL